MVILLEQENKEQLELGAPDVMEAKSKGGQKEI